MRRWCVPEEPGRLVPRPVGPLRREQIGDGPLPLRKRVIVTSFVLAAFGCTIRKETVTGFPAVTGATGLKSATCVTSTFWIVGVFGPPGDTVALLREIKRAFDPAGILNAGRGIV